MSRANHRAVVKEDGEGRPFIVFELLRGGEEIPASRQVNLLRLSLRPGTSYEDAQALARDINARELSPFGLKVYPLYPLLLDHGQSLLWGPVEITDILYDVERLIQFCELTLEVFMNDNADTLEEFLNDNGYSLERLLSEGALTKLEGSSFESYADFRAHFDADKRFTAARIKRLRWPEILRETLGWEEQDEVQETSEETAEKPITLTVAVDKFKVSRPTIMRAIRSGKLNSHRPKTSPSNAGHLVMESELDRLYPRY